MPASSEALQTQPELPRQPEVMVASEPYPLEKLEEYLKPIEADQEVLPSGNSFGEQVSWDEMNAMVRARVAAYAVSERVYSDDLANMEQLVRHEAALRYLEWQKDGYPADREPADSGVGEEVWSEECNSLTTSFNYWVQAEGKTPSEARQAVIGDCDDFSKLAREEWLPESKDETEVSHDVAPTPQESLEHAIVAAQNNVSAQLYAPSGLRVRNGDTAEVSRGGFTGFGSGFRESDYGAIFNERNTPVDAPSEFVQFSYVEDNPYDSRKPTVINPETSESEAAITVHYKFKYTAMDARRAMAGQLPPMLDSTGRPGRFVEVAATLPKSIAEQLQRAIVAEPRIVRQLVDRLIVAEGGIDEQTWKSQSARMRPDFESPAYNDEKWTIGIYGIDGAAI